MSCQCNFSLGVTLLTKQLKNINFQALLQLNKGRKLKHIAWLCGRVLNLIGTCCPGSKMACDQDVRTQCTCFYDASFPQWKTVKETAISWSRLVWSDWHRIACEFAAPVKVA